MKIRAAKAAFPHTIPVLVGYVFMGIAFGILLASKGYHFGWALLMAVTIFSGTMQFVAINFLSGPFSFLYIALMSLMVNCRYTFYGISMLQKFKGLGWRKYYMIFALTDETYSLLCTEHAPEGVDEGWFMFFIAFLNHLYWIFGCTIGAVAGSFFSFNTKGIDFVMTALFVVIMVDQWKASKNHLPALIGLIGTALCLVVFGKDRFIVASLALIVAALTAVRSKLEKAVEEAAQCL